MVIKFERTQLSHLLAENLIIWRLRHAFSFSSWDKSYTLTKSEYVTSEIKRCNDFYALISVRIRNLVVLEKHLFIATKYAMIGMKLTIAEFKCLDFWTNYDWGCLDFCANQTKGAQISVQIKILVSRFLYTSGLSCLDFCVVKILVHRFLCKSGLSCYLQNVFISRK